MPKRALDLSVATLALILLSPFLVAIALMVRTKLGSPILHCPIRPGLNERLFKMVKFRTMTTETDAGGALLPDAQRTSPFGAWLRRSSLDELPELWNVVKGDMSLVGPRPLLPQYLAVYSPFQRQRHLVRPGMTGWAQINGRNAISWEDKFALDVWYVHNRTFWVDLRIMVRTVTTILRQENISAADHFTMPIFVGNTAVGSSTGSASAKAECGLGRIEASEATADRDRDR